MFKVFNRKKKQVDLLENPISPVIVNEEIVGVAVVGKLIS